MDFFRNNLFLDPFGDVGIKISFTGRLKTSV